MSVIQTKQGKRIGRFDQNPGGKKITANRNRHIGII